VPLRIQPARIVFPPQDRAEVAAAITETLTTGALTLGPWTKKFEAAFAAAHQTPNAIAVASGTCALEIILRATGVAGGDVIVPANTFYATAAAVLRAGGRPVFADIDAATFALTPQTVEAVLTPDTKAVVIVHVAGLIPPQTEDLQEFCEQRGIAFIEDAAHAHGSTLGGRFAGSFSAAAAFSFYPTKVVTCGEGGMIATASAEIADEARIYRDQGKGAFTARVRVQTQPPPSADQDPEWPRHLVDRVAEGMTSPFFEARRDDHCRTCPVQSCCPAHENGGQVT
jgi:dTDP-4-amino-4,6-dideoxygalactose transaminase